MSWPGGAPDTIAQWEPQVCVKGKLSSELGEQGKAEEMNQEHKLQRDEMGCHRAAAQGGECKGPVVNDSKFMSIFTSCLPVSVED